MPHLTWLIFCTILLTERNELLIAAIRQRANTLPHKEITHSRDQERVNSAWDSRYQWEVFSNAMERANDESMEVGVMEN